jgi:hypothetical protein
MDQLHTRLNALEQQLRTVNRRLRWWRGLAGGLVALAVLTWTLPFGSAQEGARGGEKGLAQRVAALEDLLKHFSREGNEVFITGPTCISATAWGRRAAVPKRSPFRIARTGWAI